MIKILSGQYKSRRLKTPRDNETTRPWTGRARESVFNQLRGHIGDGIVLDLFSGIGTMGLEAASRGAKEVVLVEQDRKIFAMLEENIATLDCKDIAIALQSDALSSVPLLRVQRPVDVIFIDPPYAMMVDVVTRERIFDQVRTFNTILDPEGLVVLRTPIDPRLTDHTIDNLVGPEVHKMGPGMWVLFYGMAT
ncbi:MAG: 16S rRNA (guanine(966)-N(2))-methyltransferase RsmD [Phycisphaerales bacterium]|nr:16S rRNA (guanine(966)-N(2))-methyltransferase RsmD [Phycisphaerales bacterium]